MNNFILTDDLLGNFGFQFLDFVLQKPDAFHIIAHSPTN